MCRSILCIKQTSVSHIDLSLPALWQLTQFHTLSLNAIMLKCAPKLLTSKKIEKSSMKEENNDSNTLNFLEVFFFVCLHYFSCTCEFYHSLPLSWKSLINFRKLKLKRTFKLADAVTDVVNCGSILASRHHIPFVMECCMWQWVEWQQELRRGKRKTHIIGLWTLFTEDFQCGKMDSFSSTSKDRDESLFFPIELFF